MNNKLIELFKKFIKFAAANWIAIVIIAALLITQGTCSKIANNKLAKKDAKIEEMNKDIKKLRDELALNAEQQIILDGQLKTIFAELDELKKEKEQIEKDKAKIAKKYADLYEKFGHLSQAQQDQLLVELLKKYEITAEVRENSLIITMTDRNKLYTFIINIDELREKLANSETGLVNCQATVVKKDEVIANKDKTIALKLSDIEKLNKIINDKDVIIKNQKDKIFWTKVSSFGKKAVPALIIGLVIGFMVGK